MKAAFKCTVTNLKSDVQVELGADEFLQKLDREVFRTQQIASVSILHQKHDVIVYAGWDLSSEGEIDSIR